MPTASIIVPKLYLALPVAAGLLALLQNRPSRYRSSLRIFFATALAGAFGGLVLALIYWRGFDGRVPLSQIAITCYWGVSIACVLRGVSAILAWGFGGLVRRGPDGKARSAAFETATMFCRAAILIAFIVPYLGALVLTYRPHVVYPGTPQSILSLNYEEVTFPATDGMRLRGWWIPAGRNAQTDDDNPAPAPGDRTIILCHGFGADKASDLLLVRDLAPNGYNVLAFDFRAHGESEGQFTTFGDQERRDVLGAVRWLRANHPDQCRKIFGLGESLGAAALIAAAAAPGDGRWIDAVAIFTPYDRLSSLVEEIANAHSATTAAWMATHLSMPVAGAQLGASLDRFSPGSLVDQLAPRPVLIIAGEEGASTPIFLSKNVYNQASQPKYCYWLKNGDRHQMLFFNDNVSISLRIFFETARQLL